MEVNIKDYLSDKEMHDIAVDLFRNKIHQYMNSESDLKRIIGNIGAETMFNILDKEIPNFKQNIIDNTKIQCSNITPYSIFRTSNGWGDKDSIGYTIMQEAINDNKEIIINKVKKTMSEVDKFKIRESIKDIIQEEIVDKFLNN